MFSSIFSSKYVLFSGFIVSFEGDWVLIVSISLGFILNSTILIADCLKVLLLSCDIIFILYFPSNCMNFSSSKLILDSPFERSE